MKLLLVLLMLNGCALVSQAPTLKYCDSVKYQRQGREIVISAHCFEAVESMIELPAAAK